MSTYYKAVNLYGINLPYDDLENLQDKHHLDEDIENSIGGNYYLGVEVKLGVTEAEAIKMFKQKFGEDIYSKYPPKFYTFVSSY